MMQLKEILTRLKNSLPERGLRCLTTAVARQRKLSRVEPFWALPARPLMFALNSLVTNVNMVNSLLFTEMASRRAQLLSPSDAGRFNPLSYVLWVETLMYVLTPVSHTSDTPPRDTMCYDNLFLS